MTETTEVALNDIDLRVLAKVEALIMNEQVNTPHSNKDWYIYFNGSVLGFYIFQVFLENYAKGEGTKFNDLTKQWGQPFGKKKTSPSNDTIKKKLQEGIDLGVIKRYTDDNDARVAIYQFNKSYKEELTEHLLTISQNRISALIDASLTSLTFNLVKHWKSYLQEKYGEDATEYLVSTFISGDLERKK